MNRARRTLLLAVAVIGCLLLAAPAAMAADGVGLYGRTDDKVVTFFAFGVMAFFAILVIVALADPDAARQPQGARPRGARAPPAPVAHSPLAFVAADN